MLLHLEEKTAVAGLRAAPEALVAVLITGLVVSPCTVWSLGCVPLAGAAQGPPLGSWPSTSRPRLAWVANYLATQFYALNYSLRQRMDILDVVPRPCPPRQSSTVAGRGADGAGACRMLVREDRRPPQPLAAGVRGWGQRLSGAFLTRGLGGCVLCVKRRLN